MLFFRQNAINLKLRTIYVLKKKLYALGNLNLNKFYSVQTNFSFHFISFGKQ